MWSRNARNRFIPSLEALDQRNLMSVTAIGLAADSLGCDGNTTERCGDVPVLIGGPSDNAVGAGIVIREHAPVGANARAVFVETEDGQTVATSPVATAAKETPEGSRTVIAIIAILIG